MVDSEDIDEAWGELSPAGRDLVSRVIRIEREKLHMGNPVGIHDELLKAIDEVVE